MGANIFLAIGMELADCIGNCCLWIGHWIGDDIPQAGVSMNPVFTAYKSNDNR